MAVSPSKPESKKLNTALDDLLDNADVLTVVFDMLLIHKGMDTQERLETRKSLFSAARCCKAFKEPALDVLWRVLPSMLPLLRLLPSFMAYEDVHVIGEIEPDDWRLYDCYSKRVHELMFEVPTGRLANIRLSPLVYVQLVRMHTSKSLLPNLKNMHIPRSVSVEPTLLLLLPSTQTRTVEFNDDASSYSKQLMPSLMATLQVASPFMRKLVLTGPSNISLDPVAGLKRLHSLRLSFPATHLFPSFIRSLGCLDDLAVLTLHVGSVNPVSPSVQRGVSRSQETPKRPFPSLQQLDLTGHPNLVSRLVDNIDLANLVFFTVTEEQTQDRTPTSTAWQLIFSQLAAAVRLKKISINQSSARSWGHPTYSISSELLLQLTDLPCSQFLETITIKNSSISLSDEDLTTLCSSLKALKRLEFPLETYGSCPTMVSILHIAKICRKLNKLKLPITGDLTACNEFIEANPSGPNVDHPLASLVLTTNLYDVIKKTPEQMILSAEFFHTLFPNIKSLGQWSSVEKMVHALQRARMAGATKAAKP